MHQSVVVTGCGRGIGKAILERLRQDGYVVVGLERDPETAADAGRELGAGGEVVVGDASDRETMERVAAVAAGRAPLAGWVNNAGTGGLGTLHAPVPEEVERVFAVYLEGYFWGCSAAVRRFVEQRSGGAIVNISSVHGRAGYPGWAAYDAAKGGIDALTRHIAVSYGAFGIRANAIAPGGVRTPHLEKFVRESADPVETEREMNDSHPLRRIAEPREIANVASFLLSAESSFVTGQSLAVDGGLTASCMTFPVDAALAALYGLAATPGG
jgi:NAD(P)-dependent dehydrogenase (short-subunit alcohol dehydrogenase family)